MVNPAWLSFLLAAVVLSACGQNAPEPATPTATLLPTAMPVPTPTTHIPVWLPTAVANTPGSTFVPAATPSLPTAAYVGKDYARGVCDLQHLYGSPRRLHGLSFFLNLYEQSHYTPPRFEIRLSVQNYTDEAIDYVTIAAATTFAIVNTRSCEIFWRDPPYDYFDGFSYATLQPGEVASHSASWHYATHDGPTPAGDYVAYAIYRFADPPESQVPNAAVYVPTFGVTIGIDPVRRADPSSANTETALRTIGLGPVQPVARHGRKLIVHEENYGGRDASTYFEVDLDTGDRTEIPKPEYAVPQRSCEPPKGLKLAKELVFPYGESGGTDGGDTRFDVKGVLEIELDTSIATAFVLTGSPGSGKRRFYTDYMGTSPIVWSDDCRYAAWTINTDCDVVPWYGPYGVFLYDTKTDTMTRVSEEPEHISVSFWGDLLVRRRVLLGVQCDWRISGIGPPARRCCSGQTSRRVTTPEPHRSS